MQEIFYEESAKTQNTGSASRRYYIMKIFMVISYVFAVLWVILFLNFFDFSKGVTWQSIILALLPIVLFIVSGIMLGRFKDKFYVDYDYTFVSGSLRFSKVIKNYKRKFIIKFETSDIEKIGLCDSESYMRYSSMPEIKKKILTSNMTAEEDKDFYFIVANCNGNKNLLTLECTETFIVNIMQYTNRTILDQELIDRKKQEKKR